MISTIYFDLNNVIEKYESIENNISNICLNTIKNKFKHIDEEYLKEIIKNVLRGLNKVSDMYPFQYYYIFWKELLREIINSEPDYRSVLSLYNLFIKEYVSSIKIYPDVIPILKRIKHKYDLAIIANGNYIRCNKLISHCRLKRFFKQIITSDEIGIKKPDPLIFKYALYSMKCTPEQSIMVGDRLDTDIAGANSVGMYTVRVLRGRYANQTPLKENENPDFEIKTLEELEGCIKKINHKDLVK